MTSVDLIQNAVNDGLHKVSNRKPLCLGRVQKIPNRLLVAFIDLFWHRLEKIVQRVVGRKLSTVNKTSLRNVVGNVWCPQ